MRRQTSSIDNSSLAIAPWLFLFAGHHANRPVSTTPRGRYNWGRGFRSDLHVYLLE
jgi:hypothetical protein